MSGNETHLAVILLANWSIIVGTCPINRCPTRLLRMRRHTGRTGRHRQRHTGRTGWLTGRQRHIGRTRRLTGKQRHTGRTGRLTGRQRHIGKTRRLTGKQRHTGRTGRLTGRQRHIGRTRRLTGRQRHTEKMYIYTKYNAKNLTVTLRYDIATRLAGWERVTASLS